MKTLVTGDMSQALYGPAWSPDGKTPVCVQYNIGDALSGLVAVDAATGKQNSIFESPDRVLFTPLVVARWQRAAGAIREPRDQSYRNQIAEVSYRDHTLRAITHDINDYADMGISADGHEWRRS